MPEPDHYFIAPVAMNNVRNVEAIVVGAVQL